MIREHSMSTIEDFHKLDIRCGRIVDVLPFPEARKASYRIKIDFGPEIGIKMSSAQLPANYKAEDLIGRLIASVVNFPPRKIGPTLSEVLILGFPDEQGNAVLVSPDREIPLGGRLF
jgi:tRNA-binding protein